MSEKDGGAAFPQHGFPMSDGGTDWPSDPQLIGMSLRDYFAAHAPVGESLTRILHDHQGDVGKCAALMTILAGWSYGWADAMLKERAR